ncbi:MAG: zf-HC2 domain-containing protein [Nitrospirota bacterium]
MNCPQRELLSAYNDGELNPGERERLKAHISACPACSRELGELASLRRLFGGAKRFTAPYGFSPRVMAHAGAQRAPRFAGIPLFARLAETVVVLAMIFIGMVSGSMLAYTLAGPNTGSGSSLFSLELFEAAPPDSVGGVYLAMTEADHEK